MIVTVFDTTQVRASTLQQVVDKDNVDAKIFF